MDLGVVLVNRLRGRPDETPLFGPSRPAPEPHALPLDRAATERRSLMVLEPETRKFAERLLAWSRARGIRTYLSETYRSLAAQIALPPGRTAIAPGKIGWHQVGRAFHVVLKTPRGQVWREAYGPLGDEAERLGGVWLGRKPLITPEGPVDDFAHFEYHPGLSLGAYRRTPLAERELAAASKRAARYG